MSSNLVSDGKGSRVKDSADACIKTKPTVDEEQGKPDLEEAQNNLDPKLDGLSVKERDSQQTMRPQADDDTAGDAIKKENKTPEEPKVEPTPEQLKRLTALRTKHSTLAKTFATLSHEETLLYHRLSSALPDHLTTSLTVHTSTEEPYLPSTHAHTIPSLPPISEADKDTLLKNANAIIKQHIKLLHEYNEIKDVAQGLIGMIADARGVRVVDCQGEFGVGDGD